MKNKPKLNKKKTSTSTVDLSLLGEADKHELAKKLFVFLGKALETPEKQSEKELSAKEKREQEMHALQMKNLKLDSSYKRKTLWVGIAGFFVALATLLMSIFPASKTNPQTPTARSGESRNEAEINRQKKQIIPGEPPEPDIVARLKAINAARPQLKVFWAEAKEQLDMGADPVQLTQKIMLKLDSIYDRVPVWTVKSKETKVVNESAKELKNYIFRLPGFGGGSFKQKL